MTSGCLTPTPSPKDTSPSPTAFLRIPGVCSAPSQKISTLDTLSTNDWQLLMCDCSSVFSPRVYNSEMYAVSFTKSCPAGCRIHWHHGSPCSLLHVFSHPWITSPLPYQCPLPSQINHHSYTWTLLSGDICFRGNASEITLFPKWKPEQDVSGEKERSKYKTCQWRLLRADMSESWGNWSGRESEGGDPHRPKSTLKTQGMRQDGVFAEL
jgi:hypothetical protein